MILEDAEREIRRLVGQIDAGLDLYREAPEKEAEKERDYRKARAKKWLEVPDGTAKFKEDWVDGQTADTRYERDLARGMKEAYRESVRNRQSQLSAWQTLVNAHRSEVELAGKGPQ